ncbi:helix-turn-helix domain-containing protein [Amycolatopsis sp. NPDC058278]|uniref:helix-turn-helix domain-containing protein n=1 Tax=Amycolatopsis sp. NPDC058278 TaxID=3346417 RepID=UPI0036D8C833
MTDPTESMRAAQQRVNALIEASSLGTAGARRLRRRVSPETSNQIVALAEASLPSADELPKQPGDRASITPEPERADAAAFDASQRVAALLIELADSQGRLSSNGISIDISLSQEEIASHIGAGRRTVARALRVLRERGIIETGRRRLVIRKPRVLRALARSAAEENAGDLALHSVHESTLVDENENETAAAERQDVFPGGAKGDETLQPEAPPIHGTRTLPIILAGHARLPSGVGEAAEMILGPQSRLKVCELGPRDSPEEFGNRLLALAGAAESVLVLADLHGGSPFNAVRALAAVHSSIQLVSGLNLPMLLEVLLHATDDVTELAEVARAAGRDGVVDVLESVW